MRFNRSVSIADSSTRTQALRRIPPTWPPPSEQGLAMTPLGLFMVIAILAAGTATQTRGTELATEFGGVAQVVDGDTIEVDGRLIQLDGIDAPELGQICLNNKRRWRCGFESAVALKKLVAADPVRCHSVSTAVVPELAVCTVRGNDLSAIQLQKGYAVARRGAGPRYIAAEAAARRAVLGIWRGNFVLPQEWKEGKRLPAEPGEAAQVCDIKGIIDDKGQRIFYTPVDKRYDSAQVDVSRGERMFCSDDEARLAGWRRHGRP